MGRRTMHSRFGAQQSRATMAAGTGVDLHLGALGPSFLGLPVVVAGALALVAEVARRHAQARVAALVAEEEARLLVLRVGAPPGALRRALCNTPPIQRSMHHP